MIIGIDPGVSGAIAVLSSDDGRCLYCAPVLCREGDSGKSEVCALKNYRVLCDLEESQYASGEEYELAVLEKAQVHPADSKTAAFTYGKTTGRVEAVLHLLEVPVVLEPTPQLWQSLVLSEKTNRGDKKVSIARAQELYPDVSLLPTPRSRVPHHGMAEALLIARYGYQYLREPPYV